MSACAPSRLLIGSHWSGCDSSLALLIRDVVGHQRVSQRLGFLDRARENRFEIVDALRIQHLQRIERHVGRKCFRSIDCETLRLQRFQQFADEVSLVRPTMSFIDDDESRCRARATMVAIASPDTATHSPGSASAPNGKSSRPAMAAICRLEPPRSNCATPARSRTAPARLNGGGLLSTGVCAFANGTAANATLNK